MTAYRDTDEYKEHYVVDGRSESFSMLHDKDRLNRRILNRNDEIICLCDGTLAKVSQCLLNGEENEQKIFDPQVRRIGYIQKTCGMMGIKLIHSKL